jgi:DNA processing protein
MDVVESRLCLQLHGLPSLGDIPLARLFHEHGSAAKIWASPAQNWGMHGVDNEAVRAAISIQESGPSAANSEQIDWQLSRLLEIGGRVISITDPHYPCLLHTIYDPPPILYARGEIELLQQAQLGIVGSRKGSPFGVRAARGLSADIVRAQLHVCSGLAMGIDYAAHRGALDAGGKTITYPARHRSIAEEIVGSGCLLTEFPPGCKPLQYRFPKRNRIISGLSLGILVVEAALRSGSLITARTAMEQGREVFALPWSIFHPEGQGCLGLIRQGVKMVQDIEDILEELGPLFRCQRELRDSGSPDSAAAIGSEAKLNPTAKQVLCLIGSESVNVDQIAEHSELDVSAVLSALSDLEVEQLIARCDSGYIRL